MKFLNISEFDCGGADILKIINLVWKIKDIVLVIIPLFLIVMVILDFGKNVIAGKEDEMRKNLNLAIKRIILCAAIFLVSPLVEFVVNFAGQSDSYLTCITYAQTNEDIWQYKIVWDYYPYKSDTPSSVQSEAGTTKKYVTYGYTRYIKQDDGIEKTETGTLKIYDDGSYAAVPDGDN